MIRRFLFSVILFCAGMTHCVAADGDFAVSAIPPALLNDACAVKRMEKIEFRIIDVDETILTKRFAITILNEKGEAYAGLEEHYDKLRRVKSIQGWLYDASGKLLRTLKTRDIRDVKMADNDLVNDNRKKVHSFYHKTYPYTISYEVELRLNNTMFFPIWQPQEGELLSIEHSSFQLVCPEDYRFRYKAFNYNSEPVQATASKKNIFTWEIRQLPAIKKTFAAPPWRELTTTVYFAPTVFSIQGYKGDMSSWNEFGKFQFALNQDRDVLPAAVIQTVKDLTKNITDDQEKVRVLYGYLQKNTRYISIQLGIGGWQPYEAAFVAEKGYGDCKALTNYMQSLLKAAGIKSYYALVRAGDDEASDFMPDFPSSQFNHVILCIPVKDTMWLECTSQSAPAGYLGGFTGNRYALLIDENGGSLVTTPQYKRKQNIQQRTIRAKLGPDGTLAMQVKTKYTGIQQDHLSMMLHQLSKEKIHNLLQEAMELSSYQVNNFRYEEARSVLPELEEELDITVNSYAVTSGKRIFITPNIMNRSNRKMELDTARKTDYVFGFGYVDTDTCEIEIPAGYVPEALPQEVHISSIFGSYVSTFRMEGNRIYYSRKIEKAEGRFPASAGPELAKFYQEIFKADRSRIVLVKN